MQDRIGPCCADWEWCVCLFSTVEEKKGVGLILKSSLRTIKRETKSVLQLHRIQEAQREKTAAKFQAGMPYMTACVGLCAAFAAEAEKLPQRLYQSPLARF